MKNRMLLLLALILGGCVPSWNPFYTDKDLVFDPALTGDWRPVESKEGSKESWTFTKTGDKAYRLEQIDEEGRKAQFDARLLQLKEHRFLDLYLSKVDDDDVKLNAVATFSLVPAHLLFKVERIEPTLKIAVMNPDWLQNFLKEHPDAIAHRVIMDENIALTAGTAELQKFVLAHIDDVKFFGDPIELKQRKDKDAPANK